MSFFTEISGVGINEIDIAGFRRTMDRYAVCVIRNEKPVTDAEHVEFSRRLGPLLPMKMLTMVGKSKSRFAHPEIIDIGNIDAEGRLLRGRPAPRLQPRQPAMAHRCVLRPGARRLFASFLPFDPARRRGYGICGYEAAYDSLPEKRKKEIEPLVVEHSIWYPRARGHDRRQRRREGDAPPARHRLVHTHPGSGRKVLYLASHASASSGCRWRRAVPCCAS